MGSVFQWVIQMHFPERLIQLRKQQGHSQQRLKHYTVARSTALGRMEIQYGFRFPMGDPDAFPRATHPTAQAAGPFSAAAKTLYCCTVNSFRAHGDTVWVPFSNG